jgi:hypothetical protein
MIMSIHPGKWNPVTEELIGRALSSATVGDIKRQTAGEGARLFVVQDESAETVLAYVLRVDRQENKTVCVIVAAGGNLPGEDLTALMLPHVERQFIGCDEIRFHTARPGLCRKMARMGYATQEIIMKKDL